ncbi:MAG: bifunctional N(6)-L-threonylcarbamoyladenine synthase/serine/threonine protein kinase [Candidatus Diapherotrites archaeon]|nr:bifunctional N(6)-L-threonylcarbamoyladenine synthase/serine/threonine protein kinase [Candidatus Diapherotrites archaeon]
MGFCLGIESTAHTFGVGIVDTQCNVLANEKKSYTSEDAGIKPREAADFHMKNASEILQSALKKTGLTWKDLNVIAFSQGPGLGPCLGVGCTTARTLSMLHRIPLLGVNHCVAHIEIGKKLTGSKDPIIAYVSGGNSQIIGYESRRYRVFGETLDIGVGNLFDVFARDLGLGFPGGPKLDQRYFGAEAYIPLPYSVKGMDLVFSGLLTAAKKQAGKMDETDLCYSLMHTALAMITEVTERALAHTGKEEVLLTGGVAASKALQKMMQEMCDARGAKLYIVPKEYAMDNGAMIAWLGLVEFLAGKRMKLENTQVNQRFRTDHVNVHWMK